MVAGMLTAISSLFPACLIAAGIFGGRTVDHVDLGHRRKESAAAEASELHRR
jgi:hypothetical protein